MKRIMILVAVLALASCGKKKDETPATPPAGSGSAMAGSGSSAMAGSGSAMAGSGSAGSAAVAAKAVDVPTEQDFEKQAADKINDKNVESQVKQIETDLGQQP